MYVPIPQDMTAEWFPSDNRAKQCLRPQAICEHFKGCCMCTMYIGGNSSPFKYPHCDTLPSLRVVSKYMYLCMYVCTVCMYSMYSCTGILKNFNLLMQKYSQGRSTLNIGDVVVNQFFPLIFFLICFNRRF